MTLFSLLEPALAALDLAPENLQIAEAEPLAGRYYPNLSTDRPALVGPLGDLEVCARLGQVLCRAYPSGHVVTIACGLDTDAPNTRRRSLCLLGKEPLPEGACLLYLPPLACPGAVETFQDVVAHLRAPDGCLWDREQTHRSLRQGFQEEAYELLDALDRDDMVSLEEELGDVLLHVLLQAQIASELGEFQMRDVVCHVHTKIVHRHPHVFEDLAVSGVDEILTNWETLKRQEKSAGPQARSPLEGVSPALPALARAQSLQRHVRPDLLPEAPEDTISRIRKALGQLVTCGETAEQQSLLGTMLFDLCNLARMMGLDAESALRERNNRFESQF